MTIECLGYDMQAAFVGSTISELLSPVIAGLTVCCQTLPGLTNQKKLIAWIFGI